jgi:CHAD domain-containing protein
MAFALKRGRGVGFELRRLLEHQLHIASDALHGDADDVRSARRRLKKARAILQAAQPALGDVCSSIDRQLRRAGHLLTPVADADAVIRTLDALRGFLRARLPDDQIALLRTALGREAARLRDGSADVSERVIRILTKQREALEEFDSAACGVHSMAGAVRRARRNARAARRHAFAHPTTAAFHAWRRRVKTEWYLLRLLDDVSGHRLIDDERRLEQLDGCLGQLNDLAVLQNYVRERSPLPRSDTARALMAIRGSARDLKRHTRLLAGALDEAPRQLEERVLALWLSPRPRIEAVEGEACPSAA